MSEPIEFSAELVEDEGEEARVRRIVREEIASLAGKALRRTQDRQYTRSPDRNLAMDVVNEEAAQFWGEVLAEYSDEKIVDGDTGETVGWPIPTETVKPPPGSGS